MPVSADPDVHRAHIQQYLDLGFDRIYLHNAGRNQREWLDVFGRDVLPRADAMNGGFSVLPVPGIPEIVAGDDLAKLIGDALPPLEAGDILAVTSKIVSKAEGRQVLAADREDAITAETVRVVASREHAHGVTRIVENRQGLVLAAAAASTRATHRRARCCCCPRIPTLRHWRCAPRSASASGSMSAWSSPTRSGGPGGRARPISRSAQPASACSTTSAAPATRTAGDWMSRSRPSADEIAGAADLVKGKTSGVPVAIVRGLGHLVTELDAPGARAIVRPPETDMFRLGTKEAWDEGYRAGLHAASNGEPPSGLTGSRDRKT